VRLNDTSLRGDWVDLRHAADAGGGRRAGPQAVALATEAGLDGYYRVGQWLPVRVQLENNGAPIDGRVEVVLARPNGGEVTYRYPVNLPMQSHKEITLYLSPNQYTSRLRVALLDQAGQVIATQEQPLTAVDINDRLYGILADQPSAFNTLMEIDPPDGVALTAQLTVRGLPDRSVALDALDALIISNVDTGILTPAQRAALSAWVANGGRLIVAGGTGWQKTSAGLGGLLPLQPNNATTLNAVPALQTFANTTADAGSLIVATGALPADAQAMVSEPHTAHHPPIFKASAKSVLQDDPAVLTQDVWRLSPAHHGNQKTSGPMAFKIEHRRDNHMMLPTNLPPHRDLRLCNYYMAAIGPINYFAL
jgi:hypothetical protein